MSDNPWNDPAAQEWVGHVRKTLVPMLDDSVVTVSLAPSGDTDIKYAVELGLSIMMEKPILLVVEHGQKIPPKLRLIADDIFYMDWSSKDAQQQLAKACEAFAEKYAP